jgi:quinol monooxygenase YgiN
LAEQHGVRPQEVPAAAIGAGVTGTFATSQDSGMFARVITAQAGPQDFDGFTDIVREQFPGASQQPGARGSYLLTDAETGKIITISLWETREQMQAGITTRASRRPG